MTAIGRALMARPQTILLDEPSMGLAPQLVEEIFEIVKELNRKEGVSFLLAEQNTNIALRYADYGYILENGRVVMDGEAATLAKLFLSPGPIYDPEGRGPNWWRTARGLFAGGFRAGDRVINTFAYHFTPAGSMLESGLLALGCPVIPAGTGHAEIQAAAIHGLGAVGYVGTPPFLKLTVDKADELQDHSSCPKRAQLGAEDLAPMLRNSMRERGITVTQMYGSADLGVIAY